MGQPTALQWPDALHSSPQRTRSSVVAAASASPAAAAHPGNGAQPSALQPQHIQHSRQPQSWSPGFWRQLWHLVSPDWLKLLCVAAFTLVSVIATVSVGPAVGRGPFSQNDNF